MNPILKTDKNGNVIQNTTGKDYTFTPTGDIDYSKSGSSYTAPQPTPYQSPTAGVGSIQYDQANGLPLGTSSNGNYQAPTIGSIYGGSAIDTALADGANYYKNISTAPVDENSILEAKRKQYQAEIDAVNQIYADKISQARIQGQGRIGSSTAIQARGGLLGSDFGAAQTNNVIAANNDVENAYRDEQNLQIQTILGKANTEAAAEAKAKREAKEAGATKYIEFLTSQETRKKDRLTNLGKSLIAQGIDIKTMTPSAIQALATSYGVTADEIRSNYQTAKNEQAKLDKANGQESFTLGEGQNRYDASGKLIAQGAPKEDNFTLSPGSSRYERDSKTGKWTLVANQPENAANQKIVKINGVDYVQNPDGSYTKPNVPASPTTAAVDTVNLIKELLSDPNLNAITGIGQNPFNALGLTNQNTINKFNQLKSMLSLANRAQLKGSGAISDFEFKVLEQASSALGRNLSNADFRAELEKLQKGLESNSSQSPEGATKGADGKYYKELPDGSWEEVAFNSGGATSNAQVANPTTLAKAIKTVESQGNYNAKGGSGEFGAYQFLPSTWRQWAGEYLGNPNAPMTPDNQDHVAEAKIADLLNQGYDEKQIALIWNGGTPKVKKGVNKYGVAYDSGAYADKILQQLYG